MASRMWLDAIGLILLGLFGWMGFRRGALDGALRLFSLLAAYAGAVYAGPRFGPGVAEGLGMPVVVGTPIAGVAAFGLIFLVLGRGGAVLKAWDAKRDPTRSDGDRVLGAAIGLARGALLVVLVGWAALWMEALHAVGSGPRVPDTSSSLLAEVSERVVETGARAVLGGDAPSARMTTELLARPGRTALELQGLLDHPAIHALAEDPGFVSDLENGAVDRAMNRMSFIRMSRDTELRQSLSELGLVGAAASTDVRAFRSDAREVLVEVAERIHGLSEDPEVRALAQDPEVQEAIADGRPLWLLTHPGFRALVDRVSGQKP